jgi:tRNA uridine 5-carboxymethylaminomethyl modification enzyme
LQEKEAILNEAKDLFNTLRFKAIDINPFLKSKGTNEIDASETISKILKRPEVNLKDLICETKLKENNLSQKLLNDELTLQQVEIELKYEGYIEKQEEMVEKLSKLDEIKIIETFDFLKIKQISIEGREKLNKFKPRTLGQASRISGITPSDISVLLIYLKN